MKNYFNNPVALVALLALSFIHKGLPWHFGGTLVALWWHFGRQLAFFYRVCANSATKVPLNKKPQTLAVIGLQGVCANSANSATL